jgi:hypothetical protein
MFLAQIIYCQVDRTQIGGRDPRWVTYVCATRRFVSLATDTGNDWVKGRNLEDLRMNIKYGYKLGTLLKDKQPVVKRAFDAVGELLGQAVTPSPYFRGYWLGNSISAANTLTYTQWIVSFLSRVVVKVEFGSPEGAGAQSFAYCDSQKYRGQQQFGSNYSNTLTAPCTIMVGPKFFSNESSRGERAGTLLHELTHLVLATTDEKLTIGGHEEECYGADYCRKLVLQDSDKAQRNAENWGYYFTAYHVLLGWPADDTKYLTALSGEHIRGKRRFQ